MFIRIAGAGGPELVEPENCKQFHVEAVGDGAAVAAALGDWAAGHDDEHVWIRIDAVRAAAEGRVGPGWPAELEAMVGYAASKGWVDDAGAVRAHIEPPA